MEAQNSGNTAGKKRPSGRPFAPGDDARRNKGGRPKKDPAVVEILAKGGPAAASFMVGLLNDPEAKASDKQRAAEYILDRVIGKAAQPIVADVFQSETPLTLDEMFTIAEEVLHEQAGGSETP